MADSKKMVATLQASSSEFDSKAVELFLHLLIAHCLAQDEIETASTIVSMIRGSE